MVGLGSQMELDGIHPSTFYLSFLSSFSLSLRDHNINF